jgi:hypothetical protein
VHEARPDKRSSGWKMNFTPHIKLNQQTQVDTEGERERERDT